MIPQEIFDHIRTKFPKALLEEKPTGVPDPYARISADVIREVCLFLRDDEKLGFDTLMCLSGVDYTGGKLGVVYHLHSMKHGHKITLKVDVPVSNPQCQSVEAVWKCANWHEREAFDLFGIVFDGHPDLRRILLPDDWEGYPLRKDYQLPEFYHGMKVPY
jgi:NADH-quinone oxidoreductase subunit C